MAFELSNSNYMVVQFAYIFTLLNSSLNPLVYCWRQRDIGAAAKQTLISVPSGGGLVTGAVPKSSSDFGNIKKILVV